MDGYAYVLEALREDDCRRLRAYSPEGGARFTPWLIVVARRLLLDHLRRRYGRSRSGDEARRAEHLSRRRLEDLVAAELDAERLTTPESSNPDEAVRHAELADAVRCAVAQLPPADRLLLALRFEDDRPVREIATIVGLPTVFHVYRRLGAVLASLQRSLAALGVDDSEP